MALPLNEPPFRASILLVDDQPEALLALEAVLEDLGQNLVKARSGSEALWHLLREEFALILMDVQMPDLDGFEVAALIRGREKSSLVPIIFMTAAQKSEEQVFRGYEVGAVDYILKPIVPEILRSKVAVFVELERQKETIRRQAALLREAEQRELVKRIDEAMAFSHAVSHDLRAPLRHIESFSDILLRSHADGLDERGRDLLRRLCGAANKMTRLIDAMLQLSEATRKEVRSEAVDLSRIVSALKAELTRGEPGRAAEFDIQPGVSAAGDPQLLRLALENLLRNAWKFTRPKERARIEFGVTEREGTPAFYVRDNGVGFDMKFADKLFLPFSRLHPRSDFEGTGIGLATVQRIIQRHGGRIWGEGRLAEGASFFFTLPKTPSTDYAQNPDRR